LENWLFMANAATGRRKRQPKRPGAYAVVVTVCALVALASAWQAAHPRVSAQDLWRERAAVAFDGKARDGAPAAP
jgi:hypothetical protein